MDGVKHSGAKKLRLKLKREKKPNKETKTGGQFTLKEMKTLMIWK